MYKSFLGHNRLHLPLAPFENAGRVGRHRRSLAEEVSRISEPCNPLRSSLTHHRVWANQLWKFAVKGLVRRRQQPLHHRVHQNQKPSHHTTQHQADQLSTAIFFLRTGLHINSGHTHNLAHLCAALFLGSPKGPLNIFRAPFLFSTTVWHRLVDHFTLFNPPQSLSLPIMLHPLCAVYFFFFSELLRKIYHYQDNPLNFLFF